MIHFEHDARIHLDEAAIGIVSEALIARLLRQSRHGLRIETEVQDRVHHARHRGARARAHGDEQRTFGIAEAAAGELADMGECGFHRRLQIGRITLGVAIEKGADLGRDRETGRHRKAEIAHLGQVRTLAAQERAHLCAPLGLACPKTVNPLCHDPGVRRLVVVSLPGAFLPKTTKNLSWPAKAGHPGDQGLIGPCICTMTTKHYPSIFEKSAT